MSELYNKVNYACVCTARLFGVNSAYVYESGGCITINIDGLSSNFRVVVEEESSYVLRFSDDENGFSKFDTVQDLLNALYVKIPSGIYEHRFGKLKRMFEESCDRNTGALEACVEFENFSKIFGKTKFDKYNIIKDLSDDFGKIPQKIVSLDYFLQECMRFCGIACLHISAIC